IPYRYDIKGSDPDGEPLTYSLTQAPEGMEIDELGRITWTPGATNLGVNPVEITVTDSRGGTVTQTFEITVAADSQAPEIILNFDRDRANIGDTVTFQVLARDNVAVDELRLTFNSQNIALDGNGRATVILESAGTFEAIATTTDNAGNTTSESITITAINPSDVNAPIVSITSLSDGDVITALTDIIGTVTDDNLTSYRLEIAPVGSNNFTEIARGTNSITDDLLGEFDPSTLLNDSYILRLIAEDAGGNISIDQVNVSVEGELKIGNYQLSFTDLTIPVTGIPIIVTRTYDSHNAQDIDDFGYGWRMELRDTDLRTSVAKTGFEDSLIYNPFFDGAKVYVTLPGGQREAFTFKPQLAPGLKGGFLGIWQPKFVADAGETSELTVQNFDLFRTKSGEYLGFASSLGYNPSNPAFGGTYILTTKEGIRYEIDGNTGDTRTVRDRNGNQLTFTDGGVFSSTGQKITFERDAKRRITAVIDPNGNRIEYGYDNNGDLTTVTDREENVTRFVYDDVFEHYLEEVIDPLGRTGARSEYDEKRRLTKIIDADDQEVQLIHDPNNFVQTVKDQLGNETIYEYDPRGNVVTEIDARGGVIARTYDEQNNMLTETDALGNTTTFTYDNRANVLTETDALGNLTRYTYNSFGDVLTTTDPLGNTVTNTYDRNGNLTSISGYSNGTTSLNYDASGNLTSYNDGTGTITFEYDGSGNITRQVDAEGNATTYTYDGKGNQLTETKTMTTSDGEVTLVTTMEYDSEDRVIKLTDPEGGINETIYDAAGNKIEDIDPNGRSTKYVYNNLGELIETIYADSTPDDDTDNPRTRTEYDAKGQVIAEIDELGRKTQFVYDSVGNLIATIYPDSTPDDDTDNPRTRTEYDLIGRAVAGIDERGNITRFVYDKTGRVTTTILPDETTDDDSDNPRILTTYDASGRRISETDPLGQITRFFYDDLGRLISKGFADGTTITSEYDESGQLIAETNQVGQTTRYEYDKLGLLTALIDALNNRTEYTYDELGNLIAQKDANGNITRFEYDGLNRRITTELPLGQRFTSTYDPVGNLLSTTDFNGETITYEYDERDRLIAKNFPDLTDTTMTYTLNGLRASVTDKRGTTTYQYDDRDRLISRIDPDGTEILYTYDEDRNRTAVTIPSGTTTYTYDAQNRIKTVTDDENGVTTYTYNAASYLIQTNFPNGTIERREYDELNRLIYIETEDSNGTVISSFRYTRDETGHRTAVEEQDGRRVEYEYDDLYRLTQETIFEAGATEASRTIEYTYDDVGNRLSRVDSGDGTTIYTYNKNDRLLTEDKDGVETTYTYDNNGNTISKTTGTETVTYNWDVEDRLIASDTDGDGVNDLENQYDVDGVRVAQTVNGEETRFLIDTNRPYAQVLEEYTDGGIIKVSYVYGHDLISQERNNAQSFYHVDGLGSTRALSDESGVVTDSYIYDAFGQVLTQIGDTENSYLFTGEQFDNELSQYYLRARYYEPSTGRFTQRDTWMGDRGRPITLNKYLYGDANPVNRIDPSGHFTLIELNVSANIRSTLSSLATRGQFLFRVLDTVEAVSGFFDLINAIRVVMGQGTSITLHSPNYFQRPPGVNFREALESASYNFPRAIGTGLGNWSKGYATTKQKHGANSLKAFLLYMPLTVAGLPAVAVPTPAKVKFGKVKVPINLVFGSNNPNALGQLFGIGINMASKRQLVRMDYHTFNTGHGGAVGVRPNEISVIRDGSFHYHVLKW
ncbi:RHS repeat-associated core domain-containing protein, partial [Cyanothece sp. BG0011]|uniref:RHS repeat-associated core domain-containing protein n=1 Tax=Cyanothece sp. BG0011 TaxID=2082950 RepID=UPI001E5F3F24